MMMKSKGKVLWFLFFLLVKQTSPAVPNIVESNVETYVVQRREGNFDLFIVNMKPNQYCTSGKVSGWCPLLKAVHQSSENRSSCMCQCFPPFNTFMPSNQTCVNATLAARFGGCQWYFNAADGLALLYYPVILAQSSKAFSVSRARSCTLRSDYSIHDYNGFQSNWETVSINRFFGLTMKNNARSFDITWKAEDAITLSGRIIRLNVACSEQIQGVWSSSTGCILFKVPGPVTYTGPVHPATTFSYLPVTSSYVESQVSMSSATSLLHVLVTRTSLTSLSPSLSLPFSSSLPPPSSSSSSSPSQSPPPQSQPLSSSKLSAPPPPTLLSSSSTFSLKSSLSVISSSTLSPSPSLLVSSNTGTSASSELTSSFPPPAQSQTTRLPASITGQDLHPSTKPIEPAKTTLTARVSSSSAGGNGGNPGDRGTRTSGNNNGVVIGAAVGGALVLGIIVIIIVFWKRRKAGKTTEKQTKQGKNPVYGTSKNDIQLESPNNSESQTILSSGQDNQPTYQGLIIANGRSNGTAVYSSPEDEYDNCTVYQSLEKPRPGTPVYQSLKAGQAEPAHTTGMPNLKPKPRYTALPNATGTPIAKGNGATAIPNLKGKSASGIPKSKPGTKGQPSQRSSVTPEPVYNVLDGPGSEQGTTPEPLYNVLEGPDRGQDYDATNVDPLYNVLEGPNTTYDSAEIVLESNGAQNGPISGQSPDNDPLYNVLEGPESDQKSLEHGPSTGQEPLYNVLEGPGAKKIPLVEQGGPINEPLYNVLEGPDSGGSNQHAPNKPCPLSGHDNLAYEQTLEMDVPNAAVHRPGTQRESVYEALRGPTQDVYEALGQSGDPHSTC